MRSEENVLQAASLVYIKHAPILLAGLDATLGSPENSAMIQEVLTTQLPVSQPDKYSDLRSVDFNCLSLLEIPICIFQLMSD